MGIEVGIAVATVGAGKIVSKLASKGSKIMQTRHRPIAAEPDKIAVAEGATRRMALLIFFTISGRLIIINHIKTLQIECKIPIMRRVFCVF
jgi:hypothetical protein